MKEGRVGGWAQILLERMALRTMCKLMLLGVLPAALLPGLVLANASKPTISALLVLQVSSTSPPRPQ